MSLQDRARDFWDRISPRERRLVVIAGVVAPITLALWIGFQIRDGLDGMEQHNNQMRKALNALVDMRARGTKATESDPMQAINAEALSLDTYITNAAKKAKFDLKSTITPHGTQTKNGVVVQTSSLTVDKLSIDQLKDFLTALETTSKAVAITKLDIAPDFRDKDKVKADIEVSNYYKEQAQNAGSGSAGSAEKKGG